MPSVNKVILLGNLGKDPEVRYAQNGDAVCNISLATTSKWKDKGTGEVKEDTQWHRVVFYGRLAEIVGEYVKKGSPIYVEGRLKYGKYTDKDGVERYTTDIVATELQLLGGREGGQQGGGQQQRGAAPAQRGGAPAQRTAAPAPRQQSRGQPSTGTGFDDMDDDIPF